jgi:regulator of nonsense transcripts 3
MFSRAFLNFNSPEAVYDFKARFDGHVFVSTRGTQYRCSVEYAPFQKVPTAHPKKLAMEGTIHKGALNYITVPSLQSAISMLLVRLVLL